MSNKKRLYITVYNEIAKLISAGEFPVGSRLPTERELSERFKVSRPTIREAIIALEAKEQVSVKPNSGVYVMGNNLIDDDFSREISAFELLEARVLIEGEAAALAARMITKDELQELADALRDLKHEGVEDISSSSADRRFHSVIAHATHNRVIAKQIKNLWDIQENFDHIYKAHQSVCVADAKTTRIADHTSIYDAIASGDVLEARRSMRAHFSDLLEAMHDASEKEAVEETKRKASQLRERFTIGDALKVS